ncbi:MAG: hypothetical protein PHV55_05485, partial [Candidatus Omnitrophica bacterium]|nr:hypothetical protein [Candidatus Omnitrophota bacterium]
MSKRSERLLLGVFFVAAAVFSIFLSTRPALAYQVKRVIRGNYSIPVNTEIRQVNINVTGQLGGTPLEPANAFVYVTGVTQPDDERTYSDVLCLIDDENSLLMARTASTRAVDVYYEVAEFVSGITVVSGVTSIPELVNSKNITLPISFDLNRTVAIINWKSFAQSTSADERNIFSANLTRSNKLEIKRSESTSGYNNDIAYQVIQFDQDVKAIQNTTAMPTNYNVSNVTVNADMDKSLLFFTNLPDANVNGEDGSTNLRGSLINDTTVRFQRYDRTGSLTIYSTVLNFTNRAFAQQGTFLPLASGSRSAITNITVTPQWDLSRTFAMHSLSLNTTATTAAERGYSSSNLTANTSTTYNIQIYRNATGSAANYDYSLIEFPPVDVGVPNGGENWTVGQTKTINWTYADSSAGHNVAIRLCDNGCDQIANYNINITDSVSIGTNNNGSYNWEITNVDKNESAPHANPINGTLRVAVIDLGLPGGANPNQTHRNWDISNANFSINGSIDLLYPVGGETLYIGEVNNIQWAKTGNFNYTTFRIQLSVNGGSTWSNITSAIDQANVSCDEETDDICSYPWTVPTGFGSNYKIRVSINNNYPTPVNDTSDAPFSVTGSLNLTSPLGGETWQVNDTTRYINWTSYGNFNNTGLYNINLSTNSGGAYDKIIKTGINHTGNCTGVGGDTGYSCSYAWNPVWYNSSDTLRAKVFLSTQPVNVTDNSTDDFAIFGKLKVNWPNTTDVWYASSNGTINWTRYGNWTAPSASLGNNSVNISYYFLADPDTQYPIVNNTTGTCVDTATYSHCMYNWTLTGNDVGTNLRINISSVQSADLQVFNESALFNSSAFVTVTRPLAGVYRIGDQMNISWNMTGGYPSSCLCYSKDNGTTWQQISLNDTTGLDNATSFWNISAGNITSNPSVNNSYIRVANGTCITPPLDDSPAFKVYSNLTVTRPL